MIDGCHELRVIHHHPGRLRLRSRALEGASGTPLRTKACVALRGMVGVRDVRASAETGSILATYAPELVTADAIIGAVSRSTGIAVGIREAKPGHEDRLAYVTIDAVREVNTFVQELTQHRADLRLLVPATLAALSVWSVAEKGPHLPGWDNLLFWSYSVFVKLNERQIHAPRQQECL
jgi:hypothetical protein